MHRRSNRRISRITTILDIETCFPDSVIGFIDDPLEGGYVARELPGFDASLKDTSFLSFTSSLPRCITDNTFRSEQSS